MIEVEVHSSLRDFLRENGDRDFPHHLTMTRLIARALRLNRSALMQTGSNVNKYCLSYLMPVLIGEWSAIVVAPVGIQEYLFKVEIPQLQKWLGTSKQIRIGDRWQKTDQLLLTSPASWLSDRLNNHKRFPQNIPTIIERADNLEECAREELTICFSPLDWNDLLEKISTQQELIRNTRIKLTKSIFARPENPYRNYVLLDSELDMINHLWSTLTQKNLLTDKFKEFAINLNSRSTISWISRDRDQGLFTINLAPAEVRTKLQSVWQQQPVVIIGAFLDIESKAATYRQRLGFDAEMLSLKFTPNRQNDQIQLYIPERLPFPNTPEFQQALIEQSLLLVSLSSKRNRLIVLIVEDLPLQGQVGSALAAEFGSRVKVGKNTVNNKSILICGWKFWVEYQEQFPTPSLLIIATLPIPSLEDPLVANRVTYYKNQHQDWFRMYLLPTALKTLEETVVPLRDSESIMALLDNRVNFRSYGQAILSILEPCARINYIDPTWFGHPNS